MVEQSSVTRPKITFRPSKPLTKVMLILALVLSMGALITLRLSMNAMNRQTDRLRQTAAALEEANQELADNIAQVGSVQSVVQIAEEELGMVQPGTVIYEIEP